MNIFESLSAAERIVRFARMYPASTARWMATASEHVTLQSLPESTEGTAYARIGSIGWQYYGGPQGIKRDDLVARLGVEGAVDSDDADFAEDEMPDERKGWSRQEWDEAQAEDRAEWEA